jgi:hypothetical protein
MLSEWKFLKGFMAKGVNVQSRALDPFRKGSRVFFYEETTGSVDLQTS